MDYLSDFSEAKDIFRRNNRDHKISKTTQIKMPSDKKRMISRFSRKNNSLIMHQIDEFTKENDNDKDKDKNLIVLEEIKQKDDDNIDLNIIGKFEFNIFEFEEQVSRKNVISLIARYAYNHSHTMELLNENKLDRFLELCTDGYKEVPYHNSIHAADVCQMMLLMLTHSDLVDDLMFSGLDVVSLLTASLLHDLGHPSTNNTYQINTFSDQAITYNDKSVLENFHVSEGFRILRREDSNIFTKFDYNEYRTLRKRIIELILATDMMFHAKTLSLVKNRLNTSNKELLEGDNKCLLSPESPNLFDEQQEFMNFLIHSCDIGHSARPFDLSYKWTYCIMSEFWNQGDSEKKLGLKISFLCDRTTAEVPKNQIVFIKGIILPNFEVLVDLFPKLVQFKTNIEGNISSWINIFEEDSKKEQKENK